MQLDFLVWESIQNDNRDRSFVVGIEAIIYGADFWLFDCRGIPQYCPHATSLQYGAAPFVGSIVCRNHDSKYPT